MKWQKHWELEGQHAYLGASKYHWTNYDLEKIKKTWENQFKSARGTRLHSLAKFLIEEKIKLERNTLTLNQHVNDAIGFRMTPEVVLKFSGNCFGTVDAIGFEEEDRILRIHDLKTGLHPGNFKQLYIYCALFCHEYRMNPFDINMIVRIYQNDQMYEEVADPTEVKRIMNLMVEYDPIIDEMRELMNV